MYISSLLIFAQLLIPCTVMSMDYPAQLSTEHQNHDLGVDVRIALQGRPIHSSGHKDVEFTRAVVDLLLDADVKVHALLLNGIVTGQFKSKADFQENWEIHLAPKSTATELMDVREDWKIHVAPRATGTDTTTMIQRTTILRDKPTTTVYRPTTVFVRPGGNDPKHTDIVGLHYGRVTNNDPSASRLITFFEWNGWTECQRVVFVLLRIGCAWVLHGICLYLIYLLLKKNHEVRRARARETGPKEHDSQEQLEGDPGELMTARRSNEDSSPTIQKRKVFVHPDSTDSESTGSGSDTDYDRLSDVAACNADE